MQDSTTSFAARYSSWVDPKKHALSVKLTPRKEDPVNKTGFFAAVFAAIVATACSSCAALTNNIAYTAPDKEGMLKTRSYDKSVQTVREYARLAVGNLERWKIVGEFQCCEKDEDLLRPVTEWDRWASGQMPPYVGALQVEVESALFGFVDDLTVFLLPSGSGTQVDVYSASRVGKGDLGANARHIRELIEQLDDLVENATEVREVRENEAGEQEGSDAR